MSANSDIRNSVIHVIEPCEKWGLRFYLKKGWVRVTQVRRYDWGVMVDHEVEIKRDEVLALIESLEEYLKATEGEG